MDTSRIESSQIDQNSPEFKRALEIVRSEALNKPLGEGEIKTGHEKQGMDTPKAISKSESEGAGNHKTAVLGEHIEPASAARNLDRALEIIQSDGGKIESPHDLMADLMGSSQE